RTALEEIKTAARHIEALAEVKAVDPAQALSAKDAELNRTLNEATAGYAQLIDAKSAQLSNSLASHGNILQEALAASTRESEELMSNSTSRIVSEVNDALKKLNDSNLLLQRVLETSTSNLANLETSVAEQTSNYSTTVKDALSATESAGKLVGDHVGAFQTTISAMLEQFSSLVGDLDSQAASIDRAANNLQDAGNFSIDTLENRRGAMEALA